MLLHCCHITLFSPLVLPSHCAILFSLLFCCSDAMNFVFTVVSNCCHIFHFSSAATVTIGYVAIIVATMFSLLFSCHIVRRRPVLGSCAGCFHP